MVKVFSHGIEERGGEDQITDGSQFYKEDFLRCGFGCCGGFHFWRDQIGSLFSRGKGGLMVGRSGQIAFNKIADLLDTGADDPVI